MNGKVWRYRERNWRQGKDLVVEGKCGKTNVDRDEE